MTHEPLSKSGELRRQQILTMAKLAAHRRRKRRSIRRGSVFVVALAIVGFLILRPEKRAAMPLIDPMPIVQIVPVISQPTVAVEYVQTDPTITDRLSIKPEPPRWTNVSDIDLLQELSDAGQPAGIVCMNGKTMLLPR